MTKTAVLLANLGSPDAPTAAALHDYLDEFLMDPWVLQMPWIIRRLLLSLLVLPSRPKESAKAYQKVWTDQGSPLLVYSRQLLEKLKRQVEQPVFLSMRYGSPSIESQLLAISELGSIDEVIFIPLYPHFADSTVTTSIKQAETVIQQRDLKLKLKTIDLFYADPDYTALLAAKIKPFLDSKANAQPHLVFSYHGLPEIHLKKADPTGSHCLHSQDCCDQPSEAHKTCYRHQVMQTTQKVVAKLGLSPQDYSVCFQSRLGRAKWLEPSAEQMIEQLAAQGKKDLVVVCPAFVTDCLETLEEIGMRGQEQFIAAGGRSSQLIPCLNDDDEWVQLLAKWIKPLV
ncbi:MAG: ferrochelatase [Enterobacterales bacterium]|nr:ferrochelatase [Enterobacterales bacterium]